MRRIRFGAVILALLAGCGDPETSRLAVGQRAMIVAHDKDRDRDGVTVSGVGRIGLGTLSLGAHLTVVDDTDKPEHDWSSRDVKAHIEDGEYQGQTCVVTRWHVFPVR